MVRLIPCQTLNYWVCGDRGPPLKSIRRGQSSVLKSQLCPACDIADSVRWRLVGHRVGRGTSTCLHREGTNLQLGSTHFGKYFWLLWFYAFRVPFLSTGLVQTHWRWAEASKGDAEFHTHLCWVCKKISQTCPNCFVEKQKQKPPIPVGFAGSCGFRPKLAKQGLVMWLTSLKVSLWNLKETHRLQS